MPHAKSSNRCWRSCAFISPASALTHQRGSDKHHESPEGCTKTGITLERSLRVAYPAGRGRVVLRTELDWEKGHRAGRRQ